MKQSRSNRPAPVVLTNPRRSAVDDLVSIGALLGIAYVGFRLLGNRAAMASTTLRSPNGSVLVYDTGSKALSGVAAGQQITDKYGNTFRVIDGGKQVIDTDSGITYPSNIFDSKYDTEM